MRTILAIADDVLVAAKTIAREQGRTVGDMVSELARRSLHKPASSNFRNGVPLLPAQKSDMVVTMAIVNGLRDETP